MQSVTFYRYGAAVPLVVLILYTQNWGLLWLLPVVGYAFAWVGHFFFEKNKPATFQYPFFSLASDFIMFKDVLTGQLGKKMEEAKKLYF